MQQKVNSLCDLEAIAKQIAPKLLNTRCLLLYGDLGAGKTTFSKYLIREMVGSSLEEVVSPTYNYVHVYNDTIAHFDLYRIVDPNTLEELGLLELLESTQLIKIIEWPERAGSFLPQNRLELTINPLENEIREFFLKEIAIA